MGSEQPQKEQRAVMDITQALSPEVIKWLMEAARFSKEQKLATVTPYLLLKTLGARRGLIGIRDEVFSSLSISSSDFAPAVSNRVDVEANQKYRGGVWFSESIRKALLFAFIIAGASGAKAGNFRTVTPPHLFAALFVVNGTFELGKSLRLDPENYARIIRKELMAAPAAEGKRQINQELTKDLGLELSKKDVFGRAEESQEVLRVLARQKKNNVILVGEAGVGKKAIILAALKKISTDTGLVSFEGCHFVSLDIQALTPTGTEANIGKMLEQEILEKSPAIVFLENMETFKTKEQISVFVNFLYNLELKTKARFILSVGSSYYNQFLQTDPLISQNFELIKVPALTQSEVIKILGAVKSSMESFHKVKLDESVFPDLVSLSGRFLRDEALPQKAISLLEEAASDASISGRKEVSREDLLKIISQKSGVPMSSLTVSDKEKLTRLEEDLSRQVIGQPEAVKVVSEAIKRSRAGLKDPKKPIGSFLFLGPTGVGKTELAKALARTVFDSEKAFVRLDMSEYGEQHTTQRLIGSPPGYVGYEEGGQLTNPVMERPYCLILLDEIEKAHPKVFDVFLQVLDDGRLTDSQGRLADFKNTIIIATSNIGQDEILEGELERQNSITGGKTYDEKLFFEQKIMPKLKEHFRPEFINRFDDIIVFRALSKEDLKKIAKIKLSDVIKRLSERKINLSIKEETLDLLAESSYDVKFGARPLVRKIREEVENTIANKVIDGNVKEGDTLEI